jgi:stage II sporulation protein R
VDILKILKIFWGIKIMKKIKMRIIGLSILLISTLFFSGMYIYGEVKDIDKISKGYKDKLIRFHVLANSDSDEDQELKLKVRDEIIKYLQPMLKQSKSLEQSEQIILSESENIKNIGENIIKENGYTYEVEVKLEYNNFPAKQYSNIVLPAGEYKALRILIGESKGKNWWCVMFPPLCFVDENNGVIDKETDEKLRSVLTEEEYNLIAEDNIEKTKDVKMKFKIVEIIEALVSNSKN